MGFYINSLAGSSESKTPPLRISDYNPFNESQIVIDEAYYGKISEVLAIEKKIGECREKYRISPMKFNTSSDRDELERLIEKAFGFTLVDFTVVPSSLHNACTLPVSMEIFDFKDFRKYIISDGKGVKYTKDANAYVMIQVTSGLFFSEIYSDSEVMAILIHEIGHNFQTAMNNKCRNFTMIKKSLNLLLFPIVMIQNPGISPFKEQWYDFCRRLRKNNEALVGVYYTINSGFMTIMEIIAGGFILLNKISRLFNPLMVFTALPSIIVKKLKESMGLDLILNIGNFQGETFADQFASAYGYGADFSSAMRKMRDNGGGSSIEVAFRRMPFINSYYDLISIPEKIIANIFDPHPNTISRINSQIEYIEREIQNNRDLSPKMKKELKSQVAAIERELDQFNNMNDPSFIYSNSLDKFYLMCFGGDIRNFMAKGTSEEFEAAQERAEEQLRAIKKQ